MDTRVLVILALLVVVGFLAWDPFIRPLLEPFFGPEVPIEVTVFEVSPSSIKANQMATLRVEIVNKEKQSINLTIRFQTHSNVNISSAAGLLPRTGENFTHQEIISATMERVSLVFDVAGRIDVGDESRTYSITGFFFVPGLKAPIEKKITITITSP